MKNISMIKNVFQKLNHFNTLFTLRKPISVKL